MQVSIKDIAEKLGVSPALVSLVLNGKEKEGRVNEETARKIRELAAKLNYAPNRFAKALKKGKSGILGLIIADLSNPFYAKLARYIEDEAELFNYKVIIGSSDENAKKMTSLINIMKSYQVDGFMIVPTEFSQKRIEMLIAENIPVVLVDRYFTGIHVDNVLVNNADTAFKAVDYLIAQGCRKIAVFTYQSKLLHFKDRISGYIHALSTNGYPVNEEAIFNVRFDYLYEDVKKGIKKLLKSDFDGIFFTTDTLALNAIRILRESGSDITRYFKIFSFDENDTFDFLNFTVPHSVQPLDEIGQKTVHLIADQIENKKSKDPQVIIFETKFVIP
jgi:LacI family transcriptional regulator